MDYQQPRHVIMDSSTFFKMLLLSYVGSLTLTYVSFEIVRNLRARYKTKKERE